MGTSDGVRDNKTRTPRAADHRASRWIDRALATIDDGLADAASFAIENDNRPCDTCGGITRHCYWCGHHGVNHTPDATTVAMYAPSDPAAIR